MAIQTRQLSNALGAEVLNLDPTKPLSSETIHELRQLWLAHSVLLFRGVDWTPAEHIAFTGYFGKLHIMPSLGTEIPVNLQQHPEIFVVSNMESNGKALGVKRAGWGWHSDGEDKDRDQ